MQGKQSSRNIKEQLTRNRPQKAKKESHTLFPCYSLLFLLSALLNKRVRTFFQFSNKDGRVKSIFLKSYNAPAVPLRFILRAAKRFSSRRLNPLAPLTPRYKCASYSRRTRECRIRTPPFPHSLQIPQPDRIARSGQSPLPQALNNAF